MNWHCPGNWHKFFKAVSDKHRQAILDIVAKNPDINATAINQKVQLSQPTISHHLKLLAEAHLITATKKGKEVLYAINKDSIEDCCLGFCKRFSK